MSEAKTEVKQRIDVIESSYEFFLAYAAQGRTTDEGAKSGAELREFLGKLESALEGLADTVADAVSDQEPAEAWQEMVSVVRRDASASLCAVRLVSGCSGISSQLIDNLNANMHLRAVLTDLFLVDELVG
ncbi:MAG: hypothetical protein OXU33_01895 [Gemmatimonadota bacterium]|nr:hypothetical protein [Gemmatimonadota bacterium]MDE3005685.1 hypothetical protein [Gemmatimonadota bacterium]MDE3012814.1 hypothetical protein [Gemmatimonadota bacterium]